MKKLSVIIPVYNAEKDIYQCIESIIKQRYKNFEVIIVNDGSTDNSLSVINEATKDDERFKIINIENSGVSYARNIGVENAHGEYITFVDADDYIDEETFEMIFSILDKEDIDYLKYGYIKEYGPFRQNYKFKSDTNTLIMNKDFGEKVYPNFLQTNDYASVWNLCIKSKIASQISFDKYKKYAEDRKYSFDALKKSKKIYLLSHNMYHYRLNMNSVTNKKNSEKAKKQLLDTIDTNIYIYKNMKLAILEEGLINSIKYDILEYIKKFFYLYNFKEYINSLNELLESKEIISLFDEVENLTIQDIKNTFESKKMFFKIKLSIIVDKIKLKIKRVIINE